MKPLYIGFCDFKPIKKLSQVIDLYGVFVIACNLLMVFVFCCFNNQDISMSMFSHSVNDKVLINALECKGRVVGLYYGDTGAQYQVRYFYNGAPQTVYFYGDEIEAINDQ